MIAGVEANAAAPAFGCTVAHQPGIVTVAFEASQIACVIRVDPRGARAIAARLLEAATSADSGIIVVPEVK